MTGSIIHYRIGHNNVIGIAMQLVGCIEQCIAVVYYLLITLDKNLNLLMHLLNRSTFSSTWPNYRVLLSISFPSQTALYWGMSRLKVYWILKPQSSLLYLSSMYNYTKPRSWHFVTFIVAYPSRKPFTKRCDPFITAWEWQFLAKSRPRTWPCS